MIHLFDEIQFVKTSGVLWLLQLARRCQSRSSITSIRTGHIHSRGNANVCAADRRDVHMNSHAVRSSSAAPGQIGPFDLSFR